MSLLTILLSVTIQILFRMPSEIRGPKNEALEFIDKHIPYA